MDTLLISNTKSMKHLSSNGYVACFEQSVTRHLSIFSVKIGDGNRIYFYDLLFFEIDPGLDGIDSEIMST